MDHPFRPLFVDVPLPPTADLPPAPAPAPMPVPERADATQQEVTHHGAIPRRWSLPRRWAAPRYVGAPPAIPERLLLERQWAFVQPSLVMKAMMPQPSWSSWPRARTPVPRRLRPIVKVMERIDADRLASNWATCPVAEHDPLVDMAVMLLDG